MRIYLIAIFSFLSLGLLAQISTPSLGQFDSAQELREFNSWKAKKDLSKAKGWKWYARHKAFEASRLQGNGELPSIDKLMRTYTDLANTKRKMQSAARAGSAWSPEGPDVRPPGVSVYASHNLGRINCVAFHPSDSNIIYVGVAQGGVWKTENHGDSWRPLTDDLPIIRVSDIAINPNNPQEIYACMGDFAYLGVALNTDGRKRNTHYGIGVYRSIDGGENWSLSGLGFDLSSLDAGLMRRVIFDTLPGRAVAAGVSGTWETLDSGMNWSQIDTSMIWDIEQDPNNLATLYATTGYVLNLNLGSAGIRKSTDFGRTWTTLNSGIPPRDAQRVEVTVAPSNSNIVYALACGLDRGLQGVYRSTDAGNTWTLRANQPNILEWSDGLGTGGQGTYDLAIIVDPQDANKIYTGGVNIWGSEDGGLSWKGASYWNHRDGWSTHADQHYFKYNPLDEKYYVCNDGGLYRTDSIGLEDWSLIGQPWNVRWPTDWENITNGMQITAFYRLGISANNPGYLISGAQDNGTYFKDQTSWTNVYGGDGMDCLIDPDDPNTIYMSSQYGNLQRSYNAGQSRRSISNNISGNEEGGWTTPMMLDPNNSQAIYAGFGNLFRSENQGSSWNRLTNFSNMSGFGAPNLISCFDVSNQNSAKLYLAKRVYFEYNQGSEVFVYESGSLTNVSQGLPDSLYPTSIEINEAHDDTVWVSYGGFVDSVKIFESKDHGANWANISQGLPNIPVNVIKKQFYSGHQTLYCGTDIGVYFKNDTMTSWELYSDGLPNVIVSDLEIDYDTEKIYCSTFGRGVWSAELLDTSSFPEPDTTQNPNPSGLFQLEDLEELSLYPNPNNGYFNLELNSASKLDVSLEIVDVTGKVVHQSKGTIMDSFKREFDLKLDPGLYFLKIQKGSSKRVKRFVVSKR